MDSQQILLDRIATLEAENRRLREREIDTELTLRMIIQKLPAPAVALDANINLLYANSAFVELLDPKSRLRAQSSPNMQGVDLKSIVSKPVYELIEGVHRTGSDRLRQEMSIPDGDYSISVLSIRRGALTIALVYNLNNPSIRTTEVVSRLAATMDRNMKMIQNIAFLLGEEVSENAKEIAEIIKTIQYPDEK